MLHDLGERDALDVGLVLRRLGQVGQALGQLKARLRAPQAHQPRELLARGQRCAFSPRQVLRRVSVEALLAHALQLVEVADLGHAARQLGAGLGGLLHLAHIAHRLLGRDRGEVGLAGFGGE